MKSQLIEKLPSLLQIDGTLTVWGELFLGLGWLALFIILGGICGFLVYKRFRYAVVKLEKDNAKNAERLRVYEGAVEKQFRVHDYSA